LAAATEAKYLCGSIQGGSSVTTTGGAVDVASAATLTDDAGNAVLNTTAIVSCLF
jgi:hypothetical protein